MKMNAVVEESDLLN